MTDIHPPQKPADYAEALLVRRLMGKIYSPGSRLPGERALADELGVTRPTLREVIQRLARDGWLTVRQGKATMVNDIWRDGSLGALSTMVRSGVPLPAGMVTNLLRLRFDLAPVYVRSAVTADAAAVRDVIRPYADLSDDPGAYASFDWHLHRQLTILSGNPVYRMVLNGFAGFYEELAVGYFSTAETRTSSAQFYARLLTAAETTDTDAAATVTAAAMEKTIVLWTRHAHTNGRIRSKE